MDTKSSSMRDAAWSKRNGRPSRARSNEYFEEPPAIGLGRESAELPADSMNVGQHVVIFTLLCYKTVFSPLMPIGCKFYPTCSMYAKEAVERHGVLHGLSLTVRRLLRCRPFATGGYDPVPDA